MILPLLCFCALFTAQLFEMIVRPTEAAAAFVRNNSDLQITELFGL